MECDAQVAIEVQGNSYRNAVLESLTTESYTPVLAGG